MHLCQQVRKAGGHAADRRCLEQVGAVFPLEVQAIFVFDHGQSQVELGQQIDSFGRGDGQAGHLQRRQFVVL
jgi:hypothetical protein